MTRRDYGAVSLQDAWVDVGEGACMRCGTARRLYSPEPRLDFAVCAPCTQVVVLSALPSDYRAGDREAAEDAIGDRIQARKVRKKPAVVVEDLEALCDIDDACEDDAHEDGCSCMECVASSLGGES